MKNLMKKFLFIASFIVTTSVLAQDLAQNSAPDLGAGFKPTVLKSFEEAEKLFTQLSTDDRKDTQCYDRAHSWCHYMDKTKRVKSGKIFIFYTPRYQKEVDKKWWFHVAPLVYTKGKDGNVVPYVLDRTFNGLVADKAGTSSEKPSTVEAWADFFSHGHKCKVINSFQEFKNETKKDRKKQAYCFLRITPMYTLEPDEMEKCDCEGEPQRNCWNGSEIKTVDLAFGSDWVGYKWRKRFGGKPDEVKNFTYK